MSEGELLVLAPLESEVSDLLQALGRAGRGEPVAVASPARVLSFARPGGAVVVGWTGMGSAATQRALSALLARRPRALLHMGVAGALRRELAPGDAVLVSAVHRGQERRACELEPGLAARLAAAGARQGACVTVERPAGAPADKAALAARHPDALVVEMETWWAHEAARQAGVAFVGLRVVVDGLDQPLPDLGGALDEAGNPRPLKLAATLLRRPGTMRHLPAVGRAFARARERLTALGLTALG